MITNNLVSTVNTALAFTVEKVIRSTATAITLVLSPHDATFSYAAGQFLTLLIQTPTGLLRRSYSFSSTPGIDLRPAITIKRVDNGVVSRLLFDHTIEGDIIFALPAAGRFSVDTDHSVSREYCFIAAGSGIIPIFSLIRKIRAFEPESRVALIYQNRNEKETLFQKELEALSIDRPGHFKWIDILSNPGEIGKPSARLNNLLLEQLLVNLNVLHAGTSFYICGPEAFMRMAAFTLRYSGIEEGQVRKEHFTASFIAPLPILTDRSDKNVTIIIGNKIHQFKCAYPSSILDAAWRSGLELPYSCKAGRCSSCVAKCISGTIKMSNNEVLTPKEISNGLVLPCVGYAVSDLTILYE